MSDSYVTTKTTRKVLGFVLWAVIRKGHPYAPDNKTWGVKWGSPWGKVYQWTKGMGFSAYPSWIDKLPW